MREGTYDDSVGQGSCTEEKGIVLYQNKNVNFEVGRLKKRMKNRQFRNFPCAVVLMYFTYFESLTVYKNTRVVCLKRLRTAAFERSEPLFLLGSMGVSVPSLHRDSQIVHISLLMFGTLPLLPLFHFLVNCNIAI